MKKLIIVLVSVAFLISGCGGLASGYPITVNTAQGMSFFCKSIDANARIAYECRRGMTDYAEVHLGVSDTWVKYK